ncbi:putative pectinesterase [Helianthus annuus]|nr:putative pectinesterase [Helianthus annuus]
MIFCRNLFFGEFGNTGPGAEMSGRGSFVKKLKLEEAKPFISLSYIEGSKWLLPPPKLPQTLKIKRIIM